jgi:hypothetical protein
MFEATGLKNMASRSPLMALDLTECHPDPPISSKLL